MVVVICIIIAGLTEVTSNVATANILLPVMAEVARVTRVNPPVPDDPRHRDLLLRLHASRRHSA